MKASLPFSLAIGLSAFSLVLPSLAADTCPLYPIALSAQTISNATVGATLPDVFNGTQSGNFGWLTWAGSPSEPTLVTSLTAPGNSSTYVNPRNRYDHTVSIGDWVQGK